MSKNSMEAICKTMILFLETFKCLSTLNQSGKSKGIIFHKSMRVPFWGFQLLTKKIKKFFLSQVV